MQNSSLESKRFDEVETLYRQALGIRQNLLGEDHPAVADSLSRLAEFKRRSSDPDEAERLYSEAAAILRSHGDAHDLKLAEVLEGLGPLLLERGRTEEAAACLSEATQIYREHIGGDALAGRCLHRYGQALQKTRRYDEAQQAYQDAAAIMLLSREPEDPTFIHLRMDEAVLLRDIGDFEGALTRLQDLLPVVERGFPEWHYVRVMCREQCGWMLLKLNRFAEAEPHLQSTYDGFRKMLGDDHQRTRNARQVLDILYERWDKAEPDRASDIPVRNHGG